ncbi:MAG: autotransporter-associated beta strand repeat-containing protein [Planctomycetia bacterium]|nr:autotransporter-associated beta strand repeat-containing protein [Planctomycetia bacterium]
MFVSFFWLFNSYAADVDISTVADTDKTYTLSAGNSDNYFNSQTDTYTLQFKTSGGSAGTQSGNVTGNIQLVMDLGCNVITDENRNGVRLVLSGTNDFSGGLVIKNGTLHGYNGSSLGASTGTITFDRGVLMSGLEVNSQKEEMKVAQNIQITDNSWGGLRASRQITVDGKISGNGDLVIVTENAYPVILTNADNNYTGVTSVGTVQGGSNTKATLTLGADDVLPATTILEVGKSQNATYNYGSASSEVRLNGTTNTVAGLYGVGIVSGGGTLNINVADGEEYTFSGKFSGNQKIINIGGSGKQIFAGTNEMQINTLTVTDSQLGIDRSVNNIVNVGTLTLTNGTIDLQGYLTVSGYTATGTSKITNTSATTAIFHRTGLNFDTTLDTSMLDGNIRLVLEGKEGARATLGTSQSFTGGITVTNMAVRPSYVADPGNFLGVVPTEYKADAIILDGGTIQNSGNSLVIPATQGITVTEKGGSIRMGNAAGLTTNIYSIITGDGWFGVTGDMALPVILHAANTYQGETRIGTTMNSSGSAGGGAILSMGAENVLPSTSDIVFGLGTTGSNLRLYGFNQSVGALISRENGLDTNIAGAVADMGLISSNDSVTLTIGNANSAGTYTDGNFTGAIQNTGETANSISLVKVGSGKQILGGTLENTRTDLTVQGGTVELAKSSDKYAVRNLTLEAGQVTLTGDGGNQIGGYVAMYEETVFDLNGKSEAVTYLSGAGTIQNSATAQSVLTVSDGGGQNYKGIITGNIRLVKDGGGRQYLEGTNNYSGGTLIKNGILYTGGGSLGTGAIEFEGGTLMAGGSSKYEQDIVLANGKIGNFRAGGGNNGTVMTFTGVISGAGTLRFNESEGNGGSFVLSGNNTYTGGTQLIGGGVSATSTQRMSYYSVTAQSDTAFGTGTITVNPSSGHTVGIIWDATSGTRTLANDVEIQNGRSLELTKTGDNEAIYTGLISGNGSLLAKDIVFQYDLADLTDNILWDLTGSATMDSITLRILADSPADYIGETFQLFGENATVSGLANAILDFAGAGGNDVWNYGFTDSGNLWFRVDSAAVPEPSTWCLLLLGGMLIWQFRKKR